MTAPIVLVGPAMAVPSRYYRPLVEEIESRGWSARALARRGFEPDEPVASRRDDWSYADEIADLAAAVDAARAEDPDRPVIVLGHSLGGHIAIAHALHHSPPDGIVTVGASVPHFRQYPLGGVPVLAAGLMVGPLTTAFGYLPKPAFGAPGARTLMREWGRWNLTGRVPFDVPRLVDVPSLVIRLQGDPYAVPRAIDAFADRFLDPATTTRWTYRRSEVPEGGTTHHVRWVRSPGPVVDRIVEWAAQDPESSGSANASSGGQVQARFRSP